MIKRIFGCLLIAMLLLSLAIIASAETVADDETSDEALPSEETVETTTTSESSEAEGSEASPPKIVPCEDALPDGYEVDDDFFIEITLNAENGWSYTWDEFFTEAIDDDEYIYFVVEENIAQGYTAYYSMGNIELTDGNVIIITNVKGGEPPVYELPKTGGTGTTLYTVAGSAVLLIAAAGAVVIHRKRKKSEA